ncbi:hypothetical protein BRYFOR_06560 [Marvinbryantia formatexigens DSM 14469]|uniref:Uracil-DNA glycosylase-like domain-containing protein n=1 Tax=Marvinbryantia formatexigens DSM 14469 TaxID=478749 RepID=C6LDF1_9FIRM|nr:DNA-deoxyinosine glycosylase [Marvinbryantia formatexigens]EET61385.1 hypothetical protein BRYFOR_06560 [Marvinbryantia formatexigens DSM 14469]UWO26061.1 DNA-deoxyinosine glycosylase [Marvinbryantia formatexigens DSM 14469]SDF89602.1 G/U mismatch-specific uracil-DNA glycosylase [Marvinbryantia formatexigens]
MAQDYQHVTHTFEPVYDGKSRILILGTFPSVKSRENHFYYGHPQNRFWKVLSALCMAPVPGTIEEKKKFLLQNHIAIWDVIAECDIIGSSDSSIKNAVPCDLGRILLHAPIKQIFANGGKAYELYQKYSYPLLKKEIIKLPSTSPANAAYQMDRLLMEWEPVRQALK